MVTNCNQLKLKSPKDGKNYKTDVVNTRALLRIIQSIPSPKAEPFKMWLAQVGSDRIEEIADPEKAILRGADFYRAKGYTDGWINQRLQTIEMRKELTDEWKERGITEEKDYTKVLKRTCKRCMIAVLITAIPGIIAGLFNRWEPELEKMLQSDKELFMKKKVPVFYCSKDVNRCIVYLEDSQ